MRRLSLKTLEKLSPSLLAAVRSFANNTLQRELDLARTTSGRVLVELQRQRGEVAHLHEAEFQVFSQFGDDGIIQYLLRTVEIADDEHSFIEFGVEDYREANTRFLLLNDNWSGLVIDGSNANVERIATSDLAWKYDLTPVHAWIDRDNINELFSSHGFEGRIGLLSIDIDGNDYWVWDSIQVVEPVIVVVEYNSLFGCDRALTIPYEAAFQRAKAHYSHLYYGASLPAFCRIADRRGYSFVGCNSAGNNAYFVRTDRLGTLRACPIDEGFVLSRVRDSRGPDGALSFLRGTERQEVIGALELLDLDTDHLVTLRRT